MPFSNLFHGFFSYTIYLNFESSFFFQIFASKIAYSSCSFVFNLMKICYCFEIDYFTQVCTHYLESILKDFFQIF